MNRNDINVTLHNLQITTKNFEFLKLNVMDHYDPVVAKLADKLRDAFANSQNREVGLVYSALATESPETGFCVAENFVLGLNENTPGVAHITCSIVQTERPDPQITPVAYVQPGEFMMAFHKFVEQNRLLKYVSQTDETCWAQCIGILFKLQVILQTTDQAAWQFSIKYNEGNRTLEVVLDAQTEARPTYTVTMTIDSGKIGSETPDPVIEQAAQ